ncbi:MAG: hypothetical protein AB1509_14230 [Chloroflexota bacterium]
MEIDLSGVKKGNWMLAGIGLIVLLALMLIGRAFTPEGGRVLSWQEWQIRKLQKAQRVEQAQLLKNADRLAELLADEADPARVQVVVQGIRRDISKGTVEALADERQKVADAAQAVLDWAIGIGDYNAAVNAVQEALEALDDGG